MGINALRQWKLICPVGELELVFPNGAGNIESLTNITKRVWKPVQLRDRHFPGTEGWEKAAIKSHGAHGCEPAFT